MVKMKMKLLLMVVVLAQYLDKFHKNEICFLRFIQYSLDQQGYLQIEQ